MKTLHPICSNSSSSLRARLHDTRGFTLAELLISVVFLGLLVVVLGVGLNAALQSYRVANESTRANELLTRAVEEVGDELAFAQSIDGSGSDPQYVSSATKTPVKIGNAADGSGIMLFPQKKNAEDDASGSQKDVLLVASSHGLTVGISEVVFTEAKAENNNQNTWSFSIDVTQQGSSNIIASTTMTVAWIG